MRCGPALSHNSVMANKSPFLLRTDSERQRATRVGVARMCVGGTLLFPTAARRLFGIPAEQDTPLLRMLGRLAGVRNVVLGAWVLAARDQPAGDRLLAYRLNAIVDAVDVAALGWAGITGEGLKQAAVMGTALGGSVLVAWIELIQEVSAGRALAGVDPS